ncbi:MAG TPA: hypothetical protein VJT83_02740, partial [Chitinophagaceae bacterium]|nr:hypothetical protein [Chitinophagaceae bacterium]
MSSAYGQTLDYGKTYINVSKGTGGGTVETGDTLEIRATFVVRSSFVDSCAFIDVVPAGTAYIPSTLSILTNEGKTYKSFTDAAGDDCGWITGTNIRIHLGYNTADAPATWSRRGRLRNTHKPSYFNSSVIMIASYRVRVTAALGTIINTGGGTITYRPALTPITSVTFGQNNVAVYRNYGTCSNSVGVNSLGTEFNGTFGSGKPRNRGTSVNVPNYIYNVFTNNSPQDYYYGVANNTSTQNYSTSNAWPKPDNTVPSHRVFGVWDIIGDHTGAANQFLGNPAADTVTNSNAGYMLVINASYKTDSAFQHTISNLCPNTYYELSFWIRSICSKCGCDSNGKGASNAAGPPFYIPTAPGDSSGVYPNLTFGIDGTDYYTTGNVRYTGQWIKKGFTFLTGPAQTSFTLTIKNNAPGGGGNDWALDDITVATCTPNLQMFPSPMANVCIGNQVDIWCRIRCFFPNYVYWTWERSTNGGVTWNNTGVSGVATPVMVAGNWEYTAVYPSFLADSSSHANRYRIRIASTAANLSNPNCSFLDMTTIVVWVNNCMEVLPVKFNSFFGQSINGFGKLQWDVENETAGTNYEIERSDDGTNFKKIGSVNGNAGSSGTATYYFTDADPLKENTYYRLKALNGSNGKYSKIIFLSNSNIKYSVKSVINPFSNSISFDLIAPENGTAQVSLMDSYGRLIVQSKETYVAGLNSI